jgi:hypothetical protein
MAQSPTRCNLPVMIDSYQEMRGLLGPMQCAPGMYRLCGPFCLRSWDPACWYRLLVNWSAGRSVRIQPHCTSDRTMATMWCCWYVRFRLCRPCLCGHLCLYHEQIQEPLVASYKELDKCQTTAKRLYAPLLIQVDAQASGVVAYYAFVQYEQRQGPIDEEGA